MKKITEMTPAEHLERAAELMQIIDDKFDEQGKMTQGGTSGWTVTPIQLSLADLHLGLALAKEDLT